MPGESDERRSCAEAATDASGDAREVPRARADAAPRRRHAPGRAPLIAAPGDPRRSSSAAQRNAAPILSVLDRVLPERGWVLEIASGSGEHAIAFARALPHLAFQPSDVAPEACASIDAWRRDASLTNLRPALRLDVESLPWELPDATAPDAILCINMIHIAPWSTCLALLEGAGGILAPGAPLVLYGPYRERGAHTAPSNEAFDASLRERDPRWGVRNLETVATEAEQRGLGLEEVVEMPANNRTLVLRRRSGTGRP